jgi:diacylglycerol kinase family enzyme
LLEQLGRMRISLIHNQASGRRVALTSLRALIEREGHELVRVIEHSADASRVADPPAELVVAAGGDGTVADALRATAGSDVPLAVLPLGTANNIAFALGAGGPIEDQVRGWHTPQARPFDIGLLHGAGIDKRFVEGVGGGLVEACMTSIRRRPMRGGEPPPWQLVRALKRYAQTLRRLRPRRWTLRIDGETREDEFLLVEVLNTRSVGPNLDLAPHATPSDGAFTVVTAREGDRDALAAYIDERLAGRDGRLALPSTDARCVDLIEPDALHVDDEIAHVTPGSLVSIRIQAAAVTVLAPRPATAQ